jgi:RNA polymerase sigma-70 factor (ECF subfamily)
MTARLQPDTWAAFMSQVAKRNEAALAQLYDGTSKIVYAMALRVVRDPSAAEDITIDVYLQVWRNAASYDSTRGEVVPWLATLTRSRAIDHLRARKARRAEFEDSVDEIADLRDLRPNPELECMAARQARLVQRAVGDLSAEQREPIELAYFLGLSHSEIAARTGLPLGTVKTRIRLGMIGLKGALRPYWEALARKKVELRQSELGSGPYSVM